MYYCPWNGFSFFVSISPNSLLTYLLSFCSSSSSSNLQLRPLTITLSPSLPPTVCLNPSLSLSVYLSPSPMQHHSFSSGNELFCLLPASSTGNNSLSSLPPLPFPLVSCRVHQILSALSGTMATRKLLWMILMHTCGCVRLDVYLVCAHAQSD